MFLKQAIRARFISFLQPWIEGDTALELNFGILQSLVCVQDLQLNVSSLNQFIRESTSLSFERARIEKLSIHFSPFSDPVLTVEVHGVDVSLTSRQLEGFVRHSSDLAERERNKMLAFLDPEGILLHDSIKRFSTITPTKNWLMTAVASAILNHCRLQMYNIHIQLQPSVNNESSVQTVPNGSLSCFWRVKQLNVEALLVHGFWGFLKDLVGALVGPYAVTSLIFSAKALEIDLKRTDQFYLGRANPIASIGDLAVCIRLKHFQLMALKVRAPEVSFGFSPRDLSALLLVYAMLNPGNGRKPSLNDGVPSSVDCDSTTRNGRELWKMAARRIGTLSPRFSLHKLVDLVILWQCYVRAYESLLLQVGYSDEKKFKLARTRMAQDKKLSSHIKHQWEILSDIEKELPIESVALAWRVARYRAAFHFQDSSSELLTNFHVLYLSIVACLSVFLKVIYYILHLCSMSLHKLLDALHFLCALMRKVVSGRRLENERSSLLLDGALSPMESQETSQLQLHFDLNVGKIALTILPIDTFDCPSNGKVGTDRHISHLDLLTVCFAINALCLTYAADDNAKILSLVCGEFKTHCPLSRGLLNGRSLKINSDHLFSGLGLATGRADGNDSKLIIWSEPAPQIHLSEVRSAINFVNSVGTAWTMLLENHLSEMWSDWKRNSNSSEMIKNKCAETPFFLCEVKSFIVNPYLSGQNSGLWKCGLSMGKLNFDLEYSVIMSLSALVVQMRHVLLCRATDGMANGVSHSSHVIEEQTEIKQEDWHDPFANIVKMSLFDIIPEKNIQLGVAIDGPKIRISGPGALNSNKQDLNHGVAQGYGDCSFIIGLESVDIAVWPSSKAVLAALNLGTDEATTEYLWLTEPRLVDVPKDATNDNWISQGRVAHNTFMMLKGISFLLEDLVENHRSQVIGPISLTFQLSSCRDYFHSLATTRNALSVALSGTVSGATISLYMDELLFLFQVLGGIFSAVAYAFHSHDRACVVLFQQFIPKGHASDENDMGVLAFEAKGRALILQSTCFIIDATLAFKLVDIFLNNSRENPIATKHTKINSASSNAVNGILATVDKMKPVQGMLDVDIGIGFSVKDSYFQLSWEEEGPIYVLLVLSGIHSVIFRYQNQTEKVVDESKLGTPCCKYADNLHQFSLSNCSISLCAGSQNQSSVRVSERGNDCSRSWEMMPPAEGTHSTVRGKETVVESYSSNLKSRWIQQLAANIQSCASTCWLLVDIELDEIFMVEHSVRNALVEACRPSTANKLKASFSIGEKFRTILCEIQGGLFFLETTSLAMFIRCFRGYHMYITNLCCSLRSWVHVSSGKRSEINGTSTVLGRSVLGEVEFTGMDYVDIITPESHSETTDQMLEDKWKFVEDLRIRLSQCSLVLAVTDSSVGARELVLEADFQVNYELENSRRKFLFDLFHLSVLAQLLHKSCPEHTVGTHDMPHFHSSTSNKWSSAGSVCPVQVSGISETVLPEIVDAYSTCTPGSTEEITKESCESESSHRYRGNCILKHMTVSVRAERVFPVVEVDPFRMKSDWVGSGSISGLNLAITVSEIQMLLALIAPLSGISSGNTTPSLKQNVGSENQVLNDSSEDTIPDGAVIAIQDLDQHMYLMVEAVESIYRLAGTIHYSLAGESALFRVRYHRQRRWRLPILWFSLISLHAKNEKGEPFRVNFRQGSGFVDISSTDDREWALWQTIPYKPEAYESGSELESHNPFLQGAFYLVNQKSDSAVAFVDGVPEFVKKPGNPFKIKIFPGFPLPQAVPLPEIQKTHIDSTGKINGPGESLVVDNKDTSGKTSYLQDVNVIIDKVILTIFHDVSDANDKVPLLRGSIENVQVIVQILSSKTRLISTFKSMIHCFDAQSNLWSEILSPIEVCAFSRFRSESHDLKVVQKGAPFHFYFRVKQVDISLTELSLDILLFLVGEMGLAGPYTVKHSRILANCCKVENCSGLSLLCHFDDNRDAMISGWQSTSIFLRWVKLIDRSSEITGLVSLQLVVPGDFSTSPINVSLLDAAVFAWRTRVLSLQDSRTFPGPFIVVDVSKRTEDGLSLVVSPMLRIHNKSGFSLELRCRRPQETDDKSASVLLKNGDTIDDSMAIFDSLDLSGGLKKALVSLSLGNFLLSFRPEVNEYFEVAGNPVSIGWSEDLKGGKAVRVSGIFDKLNYRIRKAVGTDSVKSSLSTVCCSLSVEGVEVSTMHFLVQTIGRDIPVIRPLNLKDPSESRSSPIAFQEQKEIFILPTVQVSNLLQLEIRVLLTENHPDLSTAEACSSTSKEAIIPSGSSVYLYANPSIIFFTVTLTAFNSKCKSVNSGDWVKKLHKQKSGLHYLDVELDFGGGKYFAFVRLSHGERGMLEARIFAPYTLQNGTDLSFFCFSSNQKPISREEADKYGPALPPERGSLLSPNSSISWFLKSKMVHLKWLEDKASEAILDLDSVSGFTEICLEIHEETKVKFIAKLGVSSKPTISKETVPSRLVSVVPRYVLVNESEEDIFVRQCYLLDDTDATVAINSKQKTALNMRTSSSKRREISFFDNMLRKHRTGNEDSLFFIQFCLKEVGWSWSGPICIASLGRFFLKFKRMPVSLGANQSNPTIEPDNKLTRFAAVHIVEEDSMLVMHFNMPANIPLPYRIENFLRNMSITYYQKECMEPEILGHGKSTDYVWDDLTLPHKLVVQIGGREVVKDINFMKSNLETQSAKYLRGIDGNNNGFRSIPLSSELSVVCKLAPGYFVRTTPYWDFQQVFNKNVARATFIAIVRTNIHLLCEINIDKLCAWKFFYKIRQNRGLTSHFLFDRKMGEMKGRNSDELQELEMFKVGYEVYADGPSRVLRICESADSSKETDQVYYSLVPSAKVEFRASYFAIRLLENAKQDVETREASIYSTIIVARLDNICLDSIALDKHSFNRIRVQSLNVDEKWQGAPFAAMVRRNQLDYSDNSVPVLHVVFILQTTTSNIKQVKYSSVILQPIDLNIDEETLMRLVPFWRTSLSTNSQSQQIYFKHFEIHPIKIIVSFLPGNPYSSYSSAQETLRSLLHSVIKIPSVKGMVVELNGVLLTHALVTIRELLIKCAQHYSWYAMRAIYIAKRSPMLPPAFASIFDDSASSSLDVFFDPSGSWVKLPGLTFGMFKFIRKCIDEKGFSGTKRYFGDLRKTVKKAGSNVLFAAITEISDSVLKGAETTGFNGMVNGFHQGILKLAMEPALIGTLVMEGGPDRRIKLDRSPGVDELYIEGYLQAMLDVMYKQEYLTIRVIDDQVILKNLPPNSSLINEIMAHVKSFLVSKALLKGEPYNATRPMRHLRGESEWKIGPTVLTLCEHLFVSFAIRMLRKQASRVVGRIRWKAKSKGQEDDDHKDKDKAMVVAIPGDNKEKFSRKWGIRNFILSSIVAYADGRLCRCIPNAIARRIVSGFLLSFLDNNDKE